MGAGLTATKILWSQILVVFAVVLATLWGATEWTAWRLGFQPQLGPPWFTIADAPVYRAGGVSGTDGLPSIAEGQCLTRDHWQLKALVAEVSPSRIGY